MLARESVDEGHVLRRVVVAPRGQLGLHVVEARLQRGVAGESLARLLAHGGVVGQAHHLGQVAYRGALRHGDRAPRGLLQSAEYFEHGRLARAVLARQGHALAVAYDERHVGEQGLSPELNRQMFY